MCFRAGECLEGGVEEEDVLEFINVSAAQKEKTLEPSPVSDRHYKSLGFVSETQACSHSTLD